MKIAVCIKQVVTREWQLRVDESGTWIRDSDASFELNEPDAYALEEALRLKEKHGGEVVVCSAGPARAAQVIREALARGADRAIHVESDALATADAFTVAEALADADPRREVRPRAHRAAVRRSGLRPGRRRARREARHAARDDHHGSAGRRDSAGASREARARGRLVPVDVAAAAGAPDDPERHQPAALRDAQGDHGGEEERDPQGGAGRRRPSRCSESSACTSRRRPRRRR